MLATMNMYDDGGKSGNSTGSTTVVDDSRRFIVSVAEFFTGSFDATLLEKATGIIKKHGILLAGDLNGHGLAQWERFAIAVKEEAQVQIADEQMLGEVPDEFACQLLFTLMTDPVKLPDGTLTFSLVLLLTFS